MENESTENEQSNSDNLCLEENAAPAPSGSCKSLSSYEMMVRSVLYRMACGATQNEIVACVREKFEVVPQKLSTNVRCAIHRMLENGLVYLHHYSPKCYKLTPKGRNMKLRPKCLNRRRGAYKQRIECKSYSSLCKPKRRRPSTCRTICCPQRGRPKKRCQQSITIECCCPEDRRACGKPKRRKRSASSSCTKKRLICCTPAKRQVKLSRKPMGRTSCQCCGYVARQSVRRPARCNRRRSKRRYSARSKSGRSRTPKRTKRRVSLQSCPPYDPAMSEEKNAALHSPPISPERPQGIMKRSSDMSDRSSADARHQDRMRAAAFPRDRPVAYNQAEAERYREMKRRKAAILRARRHPKYRKYAPMYRKYQQNKRFFHNYPNKNTGSYAYPRATSPQSASTKYGRPLSSSLCVKSPCSFNTLSNPVVCKNPSDLRKLCNLKNINKNQVRRTSSGEKMSAPASSAKASNISSNCSKCGKKKPSPPAV